MPPSNKQSYICCFRLLPPSSYLSAYFHNFTAIYQLNSSPSPPFFAQTFSIYILIHLYDHRLLHPKSSALSIFVSCLRSMSSKGAVRWWLCKAKRVKGCLKSSPIPLIPVCTTSLNTFVSVLILRPLVYGK
jgi:hypothetical protein